MYDGSIILLIFLCHYSGPHHSVLVLLYPSLLTLVFFLVLSNMLYGLFLPELFNSIHFHILTRKSHSPFCRRIWIESCSWTEWNLNTSTQHTAWSFTVWAACTSDTISDMAFSSSQSITTAQFSLSTRHIRLFQHCTCVYIHSRVNASLLTFIKCGPFSLLSCSILSLAQ